MNQNQLNFPRLNFSNDFISIIKEGKKTATTRLSNEIDPNSDLREIKINSIVSATSANELEEFVKLKIKKIEEILFCDITNNIAKIEDCSDKTELQNLLRKFYPNIEDNSEIKVFHFEVLGDL